MAGPWEIVVTDSAGDALSDPVADPIAPELTLQRRGAGSLRFQVSAHRAIAGLLDPDAGQLVRMYRTNPAGTKELRWHGPLWSVSEMLGDGAAAVEVVVADPWARLARRYTTAAYTSTDQGQIIKGLIDTANTDDDTGVDTAAGSIETTVSRDRTWSDQRTPVAEAIWTFTDLLDPVDVYLEPQEYAAGKIAALHVEARRGSTTPTAVFGYGAGTVANVAAITRTRDLEQAATRVVAFGEGGLSAQVEDATQLAAIGLYVRDDSYSGVVNSTTLQDHAQEKLDRFKTAQRVLEVTPLQVDNRGAGVPMLWDDFGIGDVVAFEAAAGSVAFTDEARVEACTVTVQAGAEAVSGLVLEVWDDG